MKKIVSVCKNCGKPIRGKDNAIGGKCRRCREQEKGRRVGRSHIFFRYY